MTKISVLMPIYNRAHTALYSIQSVFDQSYKDWEFLAIDDGSDDNTWQILRECEKVEPRLRPIRLPRHMGLVPALQLGNREAKGDIIVKHDSDDLSMPNRLQVIADYWKKHPETDLFYHAMYQTFEDSEVAGLLRRVYI